MLNQMLPGLRRHAQGVTDVDQLLAEMTSHLQLGEVDMALIRVAAVLTMLRLPIVADEPLAWQRLDESLSALELAAPPLHAEYASSVDKWLANIRSEAPDPAEEGRA